MKNNKLSNFEMCTLAIVGALQFAEQLRRAGQDLTRPVQKKEEKPKPVMKVGKIYELNNGEKVFCYIRGGDIFVCVPVGKKGQLEYRMNGECVFCSAVSFIDAQNGKLKDFNIRRTWKKKYDKQK